MKNGMRIAVMICLFLQGCALQCADPPPGRSDSGCQPEAVGSIHVNVPCTDGGTHDAPVQVAESSPVLIEVDAGRE